MFKEIPVYPEFPVVIHAQCALADDGQRAVILFEGNNAHSLHLTVIHEGAGIAKHELFGDESCERLCVRHGESIIVLARFQGEIIAYGVFQVNLGVYGNVVSVLLPMGIDNLEVGTRVEVPV